MKKLLIMFAGHISVTLGVVGIFIPILPTTPFLLLSAVCYLRTSEKFYLWLMNHKILGFYVKNYILYHAITLKSKIISITLLWLVLGSTILFVIDIFYIKLILLFVGIGVTIHLITLKTLNKD